MQTINRTFLACFLLFLAASNCWAVTRSILEFGAVGGDANDDGPAIQAAIDAVEAAGGGIVAVPTGGQYLCGQTLVLKQGVNLIGETHSENKVRIVRSGSGTLIDPVLNWRGRIADMTLTGVGGHCIDYNETQNARFDNLRLHTTGVGKWCLYSHENTFDCIMTNIRCTSSGDWSQRGSGVMLAGHTSIFGLSCTGCDDAVRVTTRSGGLGTSIHQFRIEVCRVGIRNGWSHDGIRSGATVALYDGALEQNGTAILSRGKLRAFNVYSYSPVGQYPYTDEETGGFVLESQFDGVLDGCTSKTRDGKAAIVLGLASGDVKRNRFLNTGAYTMPNSGGVVQGWQSHSNALTENEFKYTNFPGAP